MSFTSTPTTSDAQAIRLEGLVKSWKGPSGPVRAVRGIDVTISRGETVALLGPNGAGKSTTIDMILGLARPDAGHVSVFGRAPSDAVKAGLVGGMLQTGALIRGLLVRELVAMVASLYPDPLDIDEVLELAGLTDAAQQRTEKLSGGQTQRARFAVAVVSNPELLILDEPTVAMDVEGRRAFWVAMRGFAARRQDRDVRHPLSRGGRRQRRPRGAAGARPDRRRRPNHRDQGPRRHAHDPRDASRRRERRAGRDRRRELRRAPRRRGEPGVLGLRQAIRELLERYPAARDIEITGAGLEDAFVRLTGDADDDELPATGAEVQSAR